MILGGEYVFQGVYKLHHIRFKMEAGGTKVFVGAAAEIVGTTCVFGSV